MKKYIRTKNGIYEVIKNELGDLVKIDGGFIMLEDIYDYVIDQAESIEELCDEFVYVYKEDIPMVIDKETLEQLRLSKLLKYVYGAVWCEWGLKYVAKMNENGELVLI